MNKESKKIIVGMSGGVDSTVAAALLKKEGYAVEGIFLEFLKDKKSGEGFESAEKMAEALNIPLFKVSAEEEFKKKIIDSFVYEYKRGNTPNPCVICNPMMKFDILIKEALNRGADFVATGHYAKSEKFLCKLLKAEDKTKDQSYFLYRLKPDQLAKIIFPLGNYLKSQVREIAREINLEVADRSESQDICFVLNDDFGSFLSGKIKNNPGKIQDISGDVLGKHNGLHFYTIGQRKGINLGGDGPYYVIKKDTSKNVLVVSNQESDLSEKEFLIKDTNWICGELTFPLSAEVRVRYHSAPAHATISEVESSKLKVGSDNKIYAVKLKEPQKAITPGQSAVFYKGEEVLGGGIIM